MLSHATPQCRDPEATQLAEVSAGAGAAAAALRRRGAAAFFAAGFFLATGLAGLRAGTALRAATATFTLAGATFVAGAGDLDACNGRTGPTPEFPGGTYHYVLTETFPFIPRLWHGTPDPSFLRRGPPPGGVVTRPSDRRPPVSGTPSFN